MIIVILSQKIALYYVDALGHTASSEVEENRVEADCENNGSYDTVIYCAVCGEEFVRASHTITATGHDYASSDLGNFRKYA